MPRRIGAKRKSSRPASKKSLTVCDAIIRFSANICNGLPQTKARGILHRTCQGISFFEGVPNSITYDNLKTAVNWVLKGRTRQEQERFISLRTHYLFESRFCNTGQGHEKVGGEHGVKYARQNYLVPIPKVRDYAELNAWLRKKCLADDVRQVDRQP
jgi:hypothetical protein